MVMEYASSLATIAGLASAFLTGRDIKKGQELQEFIEWLIKHNHKELAEEIKKNQTTAISTKAFLNKEIPEIQSKLDSLISSFDKFSKKIKTPFTHEENGITVTYEELLRSEKFDIIKINAHDHFLGVSSEYAWLSHHYPGFELRRQLLTTLELMRGKSDSYHPDQIHFDKMSITLSNGKKKIVLFDISSFALSGLASSSMNPNEFLAKKLSEIYGE